MSTTLMILAQERRVFYLESTRSVCCSASLITRTSCRGHPPRRRRAGRSATPRCGPASPTRAKRSSGWVDSRLLGLPGASTSPGGPWTRYVEVALRLRNVHRHGRISLNGPSQTCYGLSAGSSSHLLIFSTVTRHRLDPESSREGSPVGHL